MHGVTRTRSAGRTGTQDRTYGDKRATWTVVTERWKNERLRRLLWTRLSARHLRGSGSLFGGRSAVEREGWSDWVWKRDREMSAGFV